MVTGKRNTAARRSFRSRTARIGIAGLLALMLLLSACQTGTPAGTETGTLPGDTATGQTDADTDTEAVTIPAEADTTAEAETYVTTTDLVLPPYTYAYDGQSIDGILPSSRDVWSDTWVATDGVDRTLLSAADTQTPNSCLVGIFYFLWRDADQTTLSTIPASDHYKAYLEGGIDNVWAVMQEGGEGHPHYWAEPYFGYYSSNDEWVLRKHAYMLADAGVDFVFFDTTNNNTHAVSHMALLKVWEEVRQEGYAVPKICFLCGDYDAEFHEIYNSIYKQGLYQDLWFYWNGKPLIMTSGTSIHFTDEEKQFFTWRLSWADTKQPWYGTRSGKACWPWGDSYRQQFGLSETGEIEQLVVMAGGGGQTGRSFYRNRYPAYEGDWDLGFAIMESSGLGLMFAQMYDYALEKQPPVVMITGWNEWIAGRWSGAGAGAGATGLTFANAYQVSNDPTKKENSYYVDEFNPEFSRDIEPMKGGFGDSYFYQMADYNHRYKGSRAVESAFGQKIIDISGSPGQWYAVGPEYRDYEGDTVDRLSPGHVGGLENGMYVNFSGRNDIVLAKVSNDDQYLYFYVECAEDITDPEGKNWMNLFLNADCDDTTGWYGYDFVLNRTQNDTVVSVDRFIGTDTWAYERVGEAAYTRDGKVLQIRIPKSLIGFVDTIDFKWADNSVPTGDIMEFLDQGDAAPNQRFNYRFTTLESPVKYPEVLTDSMVVLKSRSYNAFVGGEMIRLVSDNTNGVLLASDHDIWLPVSFLLEQFGISCEGETTYNHYGIPYVKATELLLSAGKEITVTTDGLVVITSQADGVVLDEDTLRTLYRALT